MSTLPTVGGHRVRALHPDDVEAATAVIAAAEMSVDGTVLISAEDLRAGWSRPSFSLETMSIGVEAGHQLVAVGWVVGDRAEVQVHPGWVGRGIGSVLARWTWDTATECGEVQVGQTVSDRNVAARSLFETLGYERRWTSWILRKAISVDDPTVEIPAGVTVRAARSDDARAIYEVVEAAFSEWPDRKPQTYEDWRAWHYSHASFRPEKSVVAEVDREVVGVGLAYEYDDDENEGWVEQLAVDRRHRGRGIGKVILSTMFHNFALGGRPQAGVSTDSRTGALDLYLHLGMEVDASYTRWSKRFDGERTEVSSVGEYS